MDPALLNAEFEGTPLVRLGKYRLLALIARGGMGDIYLAIAEGPAGFRKLMVIKLLRCEAEDGGSYRAMFLDEGMLAARLSHPNVVQTHEVGETDGQLYLAMEYLEGQSLSRVVRAAGALPAGLAARITADALRGLHYAHDLCDFDGSPLAIVHRDLSPQNIFLTYEGVVKIVDFGIAKATLSSRATTEIGVLKGKLSYMAPEQASSSRIDRRADVFSMGVVLWELLTGRRLFNPKLAGESLRSLLDARPLPRVSDVLKGADEELDAIVARALAKPPEDRYQTADSMRSDLEAYLVGARVALRNEDIGRFVLEHFRAHHETIQQQVRTCLTTGVSQLPDRLPVIQARPTSSSSSGLTSQLTLTSGDIEFEPFTPQQGSTMPSTPNLWQRRLSRNVVGVGLGVAIVALVAVAGVGRAPSQSEDAREGEVEPAASRQPERAAVPVTGHAPLPAPVPITALAAEAETQRPPARVQPSAGPRGSTGRVAVPPAAKTAVRSGPAPVGSAMQSAAGPRPGPGKARVELVDDADSIELLE